MAQSHDLNMMVQVILIIKRIMFKISIRSAISCGLTYNYMQKNIALWEMASDTDSVPKSR
jgi:hypothetical protein